MMYYKKNNERSDINKNAFLMAAGKNSAETESFNGAKKYSTTGNEFVDQFASTSGYLERRDIDQILRDQNVLHTEDPVLARKFAMYLRIITRKVNTPKGVTTEKVQSGPGLKYEAIWRMYYYGINHPDIFRENLPLFITVGSWKDVFEMLAYDLMLNGWEGRKLDWNFILFVIDSGLESDRQKQLVKKYLPQIKSNSKIKTDRDKARVTIAKWLAFEFFKEGTKISRYRKYRDLKSSGEAHKWQKLISQGIPQAINFDEIHGRALNKLVKSEFLENNNLENKYIKFLESKGELKFTGYPFELFEGLTLRTKKIQKATINKQFQTLVNKAKTNEDLIKYMVVRDTSGSMSGRINDRGTTANDVAKSLALFFSNVIEGPFANYWYEFNNECKLHEWKGNTVCDKYLNDNSHVIGSTNFLSVIESFCRIKSKNNVNEEDFPQGLLMLSDGEFNPPSYRTGMSSMSQTNIEAALNLLRKHFSDGFVDNFKFVFWDIISSRTDAKPKFETFGEYENVFYASGYDCSSVSFLTEGKYEEKIEVKDSRGNTKTVKVKKDIKTAEDLFKAAMSQEILELVK